MQNISNRGCGGKLAKWSRIHAAFWILLWVGPMLWIGATDRVPRALPAELKAYFRVGALFTKRSNRWHHHYVVATFAGDKRRVPLDLRLYDGLMVYAYGNRLQRVISLSKGNRRQNEVLADVAAYLATRHRVLFPDDPAIVEIRFISAVWPTAGSKWMTEAPGKWSEVPLSRVPSQYQVVLTTVPIPEVPAPVSLAGGRPTVRSESPRNVERTKPTSGGVRLDDARLAGALQNRVETLDLREGETAVTHEGLAAVWRSTGLRRLRLGGRSLRETDLEGIASLKDLVDLDLSGAQIEGGNLLWVAGMSGLKTLRLSGVELEAGSALELAKLGGLVELDLLQSPIAVEVPKLLASWPALKVLRLSGRGNFKDALELMPPHRGVETLGLINAQLDAEALSPLARLTGIRALGLDGNPIGVEVVEVLDKLPALSSLSAVDTRISVKTVGDLKAIPSLQRVRIGTSWTTLRPVSAEAPKSKSNPPR